MTQKSIVILLLPLLLMFACGGTQPQSGSKVPVRQLASAVHCGGTQELARITRLTTPQQVKKTVPGAVDVDLTAELVLMIAMGQQRTGGYGVRLAATQASEAVGVVSIDVEWRQPDPASMVTQVITSPCMLIAIPRADYSTIHIIDQHQQQKLELKLQ